MTEHISGWGLTSKELKALLQIDSFYIIAKEGVLSSVFTTQTFDRMSDAFRYLPLKERKAMEPLFTQTRYCELDLDDEFWTLCVANKTPQDSTCTAYLWRLGQTGEFCIATQAQLDSGKGLVRASAREGVVPETIELRYGTQVVLSYEDDELDEELDEEV